MEVFGLDFRTKQQQCLEFCTLSSIGQTQRRKSFLSLECMICAPYFSFGERAGHLRGVRNEGYVKLPRIQPDILPRQVH